MRAPLIIFGSVMIQEECKYFLFNIVLSHKFLHEVNFHFVRVISSVWSQSEIAICISRTQEALTVSGDHIIDGTHVLLDVLIIFRSILTNIRKIKYIVSHIARSLGLHNLSIIRIASIHVNYWFDTTEAWYRAIAKPSSSKRIIFITRFAIRAIFRNQRQAMVLQ